MAEVRRRRRARPFKLVSLTAGDDGRSVHFAIDVPPVLDPPEGRWLPEDIVAHVEWETRQVAADPTAGLISISSTGAPAMSVNDDGEALPCTSKPPLVVVARISGPADSAYEDSVGLRARLIFDADYPAVPPTINFMQTVHHFFLDSENGVRHRAQLARPPFSISQPSARRRRSSVTPASYSCQ